MIEQIKITAYFKELLLKTRQSILNLPEHFDMCEFYNPCGTTACIAGWMVIHDRHDGQTDSIEDLYIAEINMLIEGNSSNLVDEIPLFFDNAWPAHLKIALKLAKTAAERAAVAAEAIDWHLENVFVVDEFASQLTK